MNATQIHLALTHVPVILSLTGLVLLAVSFFARNTSLVKTAFWVLLAAGIFVLPVYFTGESTEHAVEHLPGVTEPIIEQHEDIAKIALLVVVATALAALAGLVFQARPALFRGLRLLVLVAAVGSAALLARTAHLGGLVRHSEIRPEALVASGQGEEQPGSATTTSDHDDHD